MTFFTGHPQRTYNNISALSKCGATSEYPTVPRSLFPYHASSPTNPEASAYLHQLAGYVKPLQTVQGSFHVPSACSIPSFAGHHRHAPICLGIQYHLFPLSPSNPCIVLLERQFAYKTIDKKSVQDWSMFPLSPSRLHKKLYKHLHLQCLGFRVPIMQCSQVALQPTKV